MIQLFSGADMALARRLEDGHAASGMAFARASQERDPASTAAIEKIAGGWAIFQGVNSPLTQALGVGMEGAVTPAELAHLETFFQARNSPAVIDLCTLADQSVLGLIQMRKHAVREISNVLVRHVGKGETWLETPAELEIQHARKEEIDDWGRLVLRGFTEQEEISDEQAALISATPDSFRAFFGLLRGERVAAAGLDIRNGLATFFGGATLPQARGRGLQLALIRERLRDAQRLNCDLVSASVLPGSASHRNYERAGFQLVYARLLLAIEPQT